MIPIQQLKRTIFIVVFQARNLTKQDLIRKISNGSNQETGTSETSFNSDYAPKPPEENDCCNEGCQDCVWLNYVTAVKNYYKNDKKKLKEAYELIPSPDVREFVKLELKELIENS